MPSTSSRPAGSPQVVPYLYYPDATVALAFLIDAFGFTEIETSRDSDGKVWAAQLWTGAGAVLIGPGIDRLGTRPVNDRAWASSRTLVYVDDVDRHCEHARAAGATIILEPADHRLNRMYIAADCGGQQWIFATPTNDDVPTDTDATKPDASA